jgi:large subunit ribosomal protein L21
MYAIIETGGKQHLVKKGDIINVELLDTNENVSFTDVLLYSDDKTTKVGSPVLQNHEVKGKVLGQVRGPKVIAFKYKRRKNYRKKIGHRQNYLKVEITDIVAGV